MKKITFKGIKDQIGETESRKEKQIKRILNVLPLEGSGKVVSTREVAFSTGMNWETCFGNLCLLALKGVVGFIETGNYFVNGIEIGKHYSWYKKVDKEDSTEEVVEDFE